MPYTKQCDNEPFIKWKRNDHRTLKTVVYPCHPSKKIELDKVINAAMKVAEDLYCLLNNNFKIFFFADLDNIDTTVVINYYGVHFSVNEETTLEEARTAYRLAENKMRPEVNRLKIVA